MKDFLKLVKKYADGFICVSELNEHYKGATHRIFLLSSSCIITILWYNDNTFETKSPKFLAKLDKDILKYVRSN